MVKKNETTEKAPVAAVVEDKPVAMKSADVGYTEKPIMSTADANPAKAEDANKVMVKAVRSFEGVEGDKGPASKPFAVSRQRYADLKANGLVELVSEDDK